jgi:hypothetical protein
MQTLFRFGIMAACIAVGLSASKSSAELLGSWDFYQNPDFLWGFNVNPTAGLRVRLAFGPDAGFYGGLDLYETSILAQDDEGRILVADAASDPDFTAISAQLTNGHSYDKVFVETRMIDSNAAGAGWDESFWSAHPGSTAPADFSNYILERFELVVERVYWTSPGKNPNGNGIWTDFQIDARLDFYGRPVPEPMLAASLIPAIAVFRSLTRNTRRRA